MCKAISLRCKLDQDTPVWKMDTITILCGSKNRHVEVGKDTLAAINIKFH